MSTYTQEELNAIVKEKSELSFKAGLEKGKGSADTSSLTQKIEVLEATLKAKDEKLGEATKLLKPFQEKEQFEKDQASFIASNGKEDIDLSDYNYSKYKQEDGSIDFKAFLEKHPSLAKEQKEIKKDPTLEKEQAEDEVRKSLRDEREYQIDAKLANV